MKINIINSFENSHKAEGLAVAIDVLRAFSVACFVVANNAERIIPVADLKHAYMLKKKNPMFILIGERKGVKLKGFDYGNSPSEIESIDFTNKTVVHTTTCGTQAIHKAKNADEVITGSFLNAKAIENYIRRKNPKVLSLICSDGCSGDNEDMMLARYLKGALTGKPLNFGKIKKHLENDPHANRLLRNPYSEYAVKDFYMCINLDKFNFVLKAEKLDSKNIYLKRIEVN